MNPQVLRKMRCAVLGEPLRGHPPEIGLGRPGNARPVNHQYDTDCDEKSDGQPHGLGPAGNVMPRSCRTQAPMSVPLCTPLPGSKGQYTLFC